VSLRLTRPLLVVLAACALLGCERMRDVKRCRALAKDVNGALDAVEAERKLGEGPAVYARISKHYGTLSRTLEPFDGGTPELRRAVDDLAALARTAARQTAALGTALESKNPASATLATNELERLAKQQKSLAARIDDECRPKDR
jgi:hypothetical protein